MKINNCNLNKLPFEADLMSGWVKDKPLISILCLTFNHEKYLAEAINGFLKQKSTYPFEIVIHDDASSDKTKDIILEYAGLYPNIIKPVINERNIFSSGGPLLKVAFSCCKGRYIAYCEGDDYWVDEFKLEQQVLFLENNPEYVVVYSDCKPFDESGDLPGIKSGAKRDLSEIELRQCHPIFTLTSCFRNIIEFPPEAAMSRYGDLFLWSLLGAHGKGKYIYTERPSKYRVHSGGLHSGSSRLKKFDMNISLFSSLIAYYNRIGDAEMSTFFRERLMRLCVSEFIRKVPGGAFILTLKYEVLKTYRALTCRR